MWFKNCSLLRLPSDFRIDPVVFEAALVQGTLRRPGPTEQETHGFVSPFSRPGAAMTHSASGAILFAFGTEKRDLPTSVLNDAIEDQVREHERAKGRKPGKRLRNEFREIALGELLPRALIKRSRVGAYWDQATRLLIVDTSSDKQSELVASCVREALGSFPARPACPTVSLPLLMSEWLVSGETPDPFELGDECHLKDPSDTASGIRVTRHDLSADEVLEHARRGKQVVQLGLVYDQRIGFVLDSGMKLRKLEFLDVIADKLDGADGGDPDEVLDAEFSLMALELRQLLVRLDELFRWVD